jgi:hypothetical protein
MYSNFDLIRVKNFIEKEEIFAKIDREFNQEKSQFVCLVGPQGSGKTAHALEYARRFIVNTKNLNVYWFASDSVEKFEIEFKKCSLIILQNISKNEIVSVENKEKNFLIEQSMEAIKKYTSNILFVFDNLTNSEHVKDYIKHMPKNVKCLITCSRHLTNKLFKYIKLDLFSLKEAEMYARNLFKERMSRKQLENVLNFLKSPKQSYFILPYRLEKCLFYLDNKLIPLDTLINNLKALGKDETELTLLIGILSTSKFKKGMLYVRNNILIYIYIYPGK